MQIHELKINDKDQWHKLWQGYLDFYQTALSEEVTNHTWQAIIDDDSSVFGFGVWKDDEQRDKLVAIAHVTLHAHTWTTQPCCYLIDLFVDPNARNQGIARRLIEHIYQFAKDKHCNRVYWVTKEDNGAARALYDKIAKKTDFVQYRHDLV